MASPLQVPDNTEIAQGLTSRSIDVVEARSAEVATNLLSLFNVIDVPADGDCFFQCVSLHLTRGRISVSQIKSIILSYALKNWDSLYEAKLFYGTKENYAQELNSPGYWGGSVEAEILNKAYGMPILIWATEDFVHSSHVRFWNRKHEGNQELNMAHSGTHFQLLQLKNAEAQVPKELVIEDDGLDVVSSSDSEVVENLEDVFLPEHERDRLELLSKPSRLRREDDKGLPKQLQKLLEQEKTLPLRIGRLLSKIYPCNVKAKRLDDGTFMLLPEHTPDKGLLSLSDLGWTWMRLRSKNRKPLRPCVLISEELSAFSDSQFVLTTLVGSSLLASNAALLPSEVVHKISSAAAVVLLSSFLYKSTMKAKKDFLVESFRLNGISTSNALKYINSLRPFSVYQQPLQTAQNVIFLCLGSMCQDISLRISRLSSSSYLLLNCVDTQDRTLGEFYSLLESVEGDNPLESAISSSEVQDVVNTCTRLEQLFEMKKTGAGKLVYRDYLASQNLHPDKYIHGTSNLYYKAKEAVLKTFFESRHIMKLISKRGKAYSGSSITSLMAYISNLLVIREKLGLTFEDVATLETVERRLMAIQSRDKRIPIPILCSLVESNMEELFSELPESCCQEARMLFTRIRNSDTHSTAWSAALRLKGVAYEGLFSKAYSIMYVPEDQKPTLSMAIQTYYPDRFEKFLQRTQLHPEVREFRPDFFLAKKRLLPVSESPGTKAELVQVYNELSSLDSMPYKKREGRAFPLPEVPISEVDSFRDIALKIETIANIRREVYSTVTGKVMTTEQPKRLAELAKHIISSTRGESDKKDLLAKSRNDTEFLIIEVGYQTDSEVKVQMDMEKWRTAISLLKDLGVSSRVVACSDCSSTKSSDWYIPERLVKVAKNSLSNLFSKLSQNSPQEVTDMMVGAISTQKLRSVLKSGSAVRTPVTLRDILTTWGECKSYILERPTGVQLPTKVEHLMHTSLCEGIVISKDSARKVTDEVMAKKDLIADWVEQTKYAVEVLAPISSAEKMLLGWLMDDIECARCENCLVKIKETVKSTSSMHEKLQYLASQLQLESHLACCHPDPVKKRQFDLLNKRTVHLASVRHLSTEISESEVKSTTLDRLCRLTLPGKTEKERSVKRAVESLLRHTMKDSNIQCLKLPTGQILVNSETFNSKSQTLKPKGKNKGLQKSIESTEENRLERLRKALSPERLKTYSENVKLIIAQLLKSTDKQSGSLCEMKPQWVRKVLSDLDADHTEFDLLSRLEDTKEQRREFKQNNDKIIPYSNEEISSYLMEKSTMLLNLKKKTAGPFSLDCILHKELYLECIRRYQNTPYFDCVPLIAKLAKFFLTFDWFQELLLYSKVCETFLQCCTEFNRSGIKVKRVRHCLLNLAIALPSNKKENMKCFLYDGDFCQLSSRYFMLSRRVAVMGAAIPYIVLICTLQCLQHSRCVDVVHDADHALMQQILEANATHLEEITKRLREVNQGLFESASVKYINHCQRSGNYLNRSSRDTFVSTISGLSIMFSTLLGPAMLLNSQPFNKQIQNMRFGMLYGLSRIASPRELGKKLSSSSRHIETYVSRLYLQLVVFSSGLSPTANIQNWKKHDLCPDVTIPSLSIPCTIVSGDRQLIFDIYLVHIYNKEMDNFDEGCIKVLQETLERHISWEMQTMSAVKVFNSESGKAKMKALRTLRLLHGLPNLKNLSTDKEKDRKPSSSSSASSMSSTHSISKTRSFSSSKRIKSAYGRLRSTMKPIVTHIGLEMVPDEMSDYQFSAQDTGLGFKYEANPESVIKDLKQVIKDNPSHTYGSFELVQAMTEVARQKFPPEAIGKAQRDTTNWQGVSAYTETTSSVSEPKTRIIIKDALKVLNTGEVKKTVKLIRNRMRKLDGGASQKPDRLSELVHSLETVNTFTERQLEEIKKGISEPSKLSFFPWRDVITRSIRDVLITNDANMIYCWLKSLASGIKKHLRPYMPGLRYCKESKPSDHPKLAKLLGTVELEALNNLSKVFTDLIKGTVDVLTPLPPKEELYSAWQKFIEAVPFLHEIIQRGIEALKMSLTNFEVLCSEYQNLVAAKKEYPDLSFIREEIEVKNLEQQFLKEHDNDIMQFVNLIFALSLCCPWSIHYKSFELLLSEDSSPLADEFSQREHLELLKTLGPCELILHQLSIEPLKGEVDSKEITSETVDMFYRYCCALFISNDEPIKAILNLKEVVVTSHIEDSALSTTRSLLAKYGLERSDLDFKWTLNLIANSNFEVTKRLTGRTEGEKLPRSVRSKVIYEMIKVVKSTGMAILQQHAFSYILNSGHRFFAVLAPKAQLGGHRDLLVQEIMTKIVHAASETFSRALLSTTNDDGLTNQHLKEAILQHAYDQLQLTSHSHGKLLSSAAGSMRFFIQTFCISGDRTKWGPIHCTSFFSGMMQQLLQDTPDWSSFFKLVMLKNLYRQVEIPAGAIRKILNSFRYKVKSKVPLEQMTEEQIRQLLSENLDLWESNHMMQFLVQVYLSKGKMALECYNHMGQGIHHATSSVMTSCISVLTEELIINYFQYHMPELSTSVKHAGSSDDYAKVVTVSGYLPESLFERYEERFWHHVCRLQNSMLGLARGCQMKDSAKTLIGDVMCEFYSEFMLFHRVTPAVIKFILTGLINSSVTSPQSMVQACQVSAQQAMYNSVPLLTNICFTLFRQQMFANHTELFQRKYGPLVHGLPSSFGRLYLPLFSNLTSSTIAIEDAESIAQDLESAIDLSTRLAQKPEPTYDLLDLPDPDSRSSTYSLKSSSPPTNSEETGSVSSGSSSSFRFSDLKKLSATEIEYLKTSANRDTLESELDVFDRASTMYKGHSDFEGWPCLDKLKSSMLVSSHVELKELIEKNPLRVIRFVRSVLSCLIIGYYRCFASEGTEKTLKANLNRDENRIVEDPMIQLVPEKLRRELGRLGLAKESYDELQFKSTMTRPLSEQVARKVITMNCLTEDFQAEAERLKQTLSSRNIIHGLAGGIKELSLPLYTIFLKSYFFVDKIFLDHKDRWNSKHSRNYRDSTGNSLEGKVVTKYMVWLDAVLSSFLRRCSETAPEPHSLFNSSLKCIDLLTFDDKTRILSLRTEELKIFKEELRAVSVQFSDSNRLKLKVLESSRPVYEREANKVVISKSGLFSAGEQVKIKNNPALVIGFHLSRDTVLEVKPSKMDLGSLIHDTLKLEQFYTSISEVCTSIVQESKRMEKHGECPRADEVTSHANTLTLLSRLAQKSNTRIISFHMIKPISTHTESTVTDLISFGTKEGRNLVLAESGIESGTTSLKYWRILHCLGAIGSLNIADIDKTNLLVGFMNWVPRLCDASRNCPFYKNEETVMEQFKDRSIVSSLYEELPNIKKETERQQIENLVDFIKDPMVLVAKKPFFGKTVDFNTRGSDGHRTGTFTLSSSTGEAVGTFISGTLHVYLSKESDVLMTEVEGHVLAWQNKMRTDIVTKEQHDYFLELLPAQQSISRRLAEGVLRSVNIDVLNPRMLKLGLSTTSSKVVRIRPHILTVRKTSPDARLNEPRLVWGKASLSIVYDEYTSEASYHESILSLRKKLDLVVNKSTDVKTPRSFFSDLKVVLGKVHFKPEATNTSLSLLHYYLVHSAETVHLEFHTKSSILQKALWGEQGELNMLKRLRTEYLSSTKPVEDRSVQLITIASNIESLLNEDAIPLHCLPEVQQYLDETGNSAIKVGAITKGLQTSFKWKCSIDTLDATKPAGGVRSIINTLGMESLPLQFAQLIADATVWNQLLLIGKKAQAEVVASMRDDKILDLLFATTVFCCQCHLKDRESFSFPPSATLGLLSVTEFVVNNNMSVIFRHDGEKGVELVVEVKSPLLRSTDKKGIKGLSQLAVMANNLLMERTRTLQELKLHIKLELIHSESTTSISLSYTSESGLETTIDKLFLGLSSLESEDLSKLRNVSNLACYLIGVKSAFAEVVQTDEIALDGGEGLATLEDFMDFDDTTSDPLDQTQEYEFNFE
ncbi:RNA-dependent RNA polymerase [Pangolin orthonairovirus]|uniref:RNA-directed RNA polymerase L n=1 Tax=Pangolin orthonairovirus TaxID=2951875 RepID=A0AAE9RUZ8_9VIRU|nr:RNA-dependent RNA polymerase [Pangolin orthonairovirus]